ncbi:MAG: hypothetical protein IPF68_06460 [Bacteroidales bacterium]|nr:hypothetical protein [Bacteroidales bacterium]
MKWVNQQSAMLKTLTIVYEMEAGSGYYAMVKTVQSFNNVADIRSKLRECPVPALIMRGNAMAKPRVILQSTSNYSHITHW